MNIPVKEAMKIAKMMNLYFIDLKKDIMEFITAKARTQLFCLKMKKGSFQKNTIKG